MGDKATAAAAFAFAAALMVAAAKMNRNDGHPTLSALFWACAVTIVVWSTLLWRSAT
jgi:hypothetical protein